MFWFQSQVTGLTAPRLAGISLFSNFPTFMAVHINILHSYLAVTVTELVFIWADQKKKTKNNIDLFFSFLLLRFRKMFLTMTTAGNVPWEANLLRKAFILQGFTADFWEGWELKWEDKESHRRDASTPGERRSEDLLCGACKTRRVVWFLGTLISILLNVCQLWCWRITWRLVLTYPERAVYPSWCQEQSGPQPFTSG